MFDLIAKPFGVLLLWLYNLVGNYGVAVFLFAVVVKVILLPFQMKSKKSMIRMAALNPQIEELKKRHEGNQQRLQQEMAKLYKEEHVSPMSGCLWSLIPFPILLALYRAIRFPLTTMMGVDSTLLAEGGSILTKLNELGFTSKGNAAYLQLYQSEFITNNFAAFEGLSEKLVAISYRFLGLNLADTPKVMFWNDGLTWASIGLFLIPIVSAGLSWLQMHISTKTNPTMNSAAGQQSQQQMKSMNFIMPLMSLWIGFSMPAALGIYWISTSLLALIQEVILNKIYGKKLEEEKAAREAIQREKEAEIERKRQETERLRAERKTSENANTSKKKQQARQKNELDELKAAAAREERAARRARQGLPPEVEEKPASQVGNRRYARGRAYVPDRFTDPEHAAEATAAAAAASEGAESLESELTPDELGETVPTAPEKASAETLGEDILADEASEDYDDEPEEDDEEAYDDPDEDDEDQK